MSKKRPRSAGDSSPALPDPEQQTIPVTEEKKAMPHNEARNPLQHADGVTVVGEAVRRVSPESAEFLIEITASAPTAAQALRDNQVKTTHALQAAAAAGVQAADLQTISFNVYSLFGPVIPALPGYGVMPQIGQGGFTANPAPQHEIQFGSYQARNMLRIRVRDAARVGEIVDALAKSGAT